jgi:hypothetical protein
LLWDTPSAGNGKGEKKKEDSPGKEKKKIKKE